MPPSASTISAARRWAGAGPRSRPRGFATIAFGLAWACSGVGPRGSRRSSATARRPGATAGGPGPRWPLGTALDAGGRAGPVDRSCCSRTRGCPWHAARRLGRGSRSSSSDEERPRVEARASSFVRPPGRPPPTGERTDLFEAAARLPGAIVCSRRVQAGRGHAVRRDDLGTRCSSSTRAERCASRGGHHVVARDSPGERASGEPRIEDLSRRATELRPSRRAGVRACSAPLLPRATGKDAKHARAEPPRERRRVGRAPSRHAARRGPGARSTCGTDPALFARPDGPVQLARGASPPRLWITPRGRGSAR